MAFDNIVNLSEDDDIISNEQYCCQFEIPSFPAYFGRSFVAAYLFYSYHLYV